jgi:NAD(P)-dependent dehydrogenase (short-subunit alcohol dehydrogenase family)
MVNKAADLLGGLAIVHSNAGICRFTPFLEIDDETWQTHMNTNLNGGFYVTQSAAKLMVKQGKGGRILFTTSIGAFRSNATQTHYCATKGGLHLLAMGMAIELGKYGITVNSIAPGWMHTDINDAQSRDEASVKPWVASHVSAGRLGVPDDMKSAVLFLASKESGYVNGSTVHVDGGWNAQL